MRIKRLKFKGRRADSFPMTWDLHRKPRPMLQRELIACMQLSQACEDWMPTPAQCNLLRRYCAVGYETFNNRLRGIDEFFAGWWDADDLAKLDANIAVLQSIETVPAPAALTIWRGVRIPQGAGPSEGEVWADDAFCSASLSRSRAEKAVKGYRDLDRKGTVYEPWLLRIDVTPGQPIVPVYWAMLNDVKGENARALAHDPPPYYVNEAEIMLLPRTRLAFDRITRRADGVQVARCRIEAVPAELSQAA